MENGLHRTLDVQLRGDDCRLRRAALNMVGTFQQPFKSDVSIGLLRVRGSDPRVELQSLVVRLARRLEAAPEADAESEVKEEAELAETCAIDGKTVRASVDADRGVPCTHIVSVRLASDLVVGRTAVPDQSNELTANRQLLAKRELEGRVVSIDALGCRTDIAETIAAGGGGYLLAVKNNQSDLHAHRQRDVAYLDRTGAAAAARGRSETVARAHGRSERRTCTIMGGANGILDELDPDRR